jgi:hypothetical protein
MHHTQQLLAITERNVATSKASNYGWCFSDKHVLKFIRYPSLNRSVSTLLRCRSVNYTCSSGGLYSRFCLWTFRNKIRFHGEELLAHLPTPKLEDHPLLAVRDCLFNIFVANLHIGGRSSVRSLRTRHAVVTGIHLPHVTGGGHLWVRLWTFGFHKMRGISWLAANRLAS